MKDEINEIFVAIRKRLDILPANSYYGETLIEHLRSLSRWGNEPKDYDESPSVEFPERIFIAYAVCHPECGRCEFIVDGSSQICQACGSHQFRTEVEEYQLIKNFHK